MSNHVRKDHKPRSSHFDIQIRLLLFEYITEILWYHFCDFLLQISFFLCIISMESLPRKQKHGVYLHWNLARSVFVLAVLCERLGMLHHLFLLWFYMKRLLWLLSSFVWKIVCNSYFLNFFRLLKKNCMSNFIDF